MEFFINREEPLLTIDSINESLMSNIYDYEISVLEHINPLMDIQLIESISIAEDDESTLKALIEFFKKCWAAAKELLKRIANVIKNSLKLFSDVSTRIAFYAKTNRHYIENSPLRKIKSKDRFPYMKIPTEIIPFEERVVSTKREFLTFEPKETLRTCLKARMLSKDVEKAVITAQNLCKAEESLASEGVKNSKTLKDAFLTRKRLLIAKVATAKTNKIATYKLTETAKLIKISNIANHAAVNAYYKNKKETTA